MLLPTSVDVLRCVERTLETVIAPALTGTAERSAAATMGHLLRHVALRIEHEGRILSEEIAILHQALAEVRTYLGDAYSQDAEASQLRAALAQQLAPVTQSPSYRSVASLADEVTALRQRVCDALAFIHSRDPELQGPARAVYESLKRYVAWELEQEAQIIDPAFEGFGPRR